MITPEDIRAAMDVLAEVDETSDSLGVEDAVAYREAVNELFTKVKETLGLIDTQLVNTLESARPINGMLYEVRKSDGKWRPDHSKLHPTIIKAAAVDENGELLKTYPACERVIAIMESLYTSASTMPKVGAMDKLGVKKWEVAEQEPGKPVLKVTPIVEAPE